MAKPVALSMEALLTQLDRRLGVVERKSSGGLSSGSLIQTVASPAEEAALIASFRPTPSRPLWIDRTYINDGSLWRTPDGIQWTSQVAARQPATVWQDIPLQGAWVRYDTTYNSLQAVLLESGIVMLRGLVKNGTLGTVLGVLPVGYRPDTYQVFPVITFNGNNAGVVQIAPDGTMSVLRGNVSWVSLWGIQFPAADPNRVWTPVTVGSGFTAGAAATWGTPAYWMDKYGRYWTRGYINSPTAAPATNAVIMSGLPVGENIHIAGTTGATTSTGWTLARAASGAHTYGGGTVNGVLFLTMPNGPFYTNAHLPMWTNQPFQGAWVQQSGWPTPSWIAMPDGLVSWRGLGVSGTYSTAITNVPVGRNTSGYRGLYLNTSNHTAGRTDVSVAGQSIIPNIGTSWTSLWNIHYLQES